MLIIIASLIAGILYRLGGWKETKFRDFGVPAVFTLVWMYFNGWSWALIPSFGILFASLTTYHKWLNKIFKAQDNEVHWYSWAMTGFCYGLAALPLAFAGIGLWMILLRSVLLAIFVTLISELSGWDILEEFGRGAAVIITMGLVI